MQLNKNDKDTLLARLQAAQQSMDEIFTLVAKNSEVATLIAKLNNCSKQLDRASFALMVSSLQSTAGVSEAEKAENIRHLEQLFLHLD